MQTPPVLSLHQPIYVLGDHHGYLDTVFHDVDQNAIRDAVILHVGDGEEGIDCWHEHFELINNELARRGLLYLGMRGNHCDPSLFDGSVDLPHFKLLPDYTRLTAGNSSWLLAGGATSIDRQDRKNGLDWWPEEKFSAAELGSMPCGSALVVAKGRELMRYRNDPADYANSTDVK